MNRVIARFQDGHMVKGTTINFQPDSGHFHIAPPEDRYGEGERVSIDELKAVFFVRSFEGNPDHKDKPEFLQTTGYGHQVRVRFLDGEEMVGYAHKIDGAKQGFFLFPGDPSSNNERIFIPFVAVTTIWDLQNETELLPEEHQKNLLEEGDPPPRLEEPEEEKNED